MPELDYFDRQKRPHKKFSDMRVRPQQLPCGVPQATRSHLGKSHSRPGPFLEPFSFFGRPFCLDVEWNVKAVLNLRALNLILSKVHVLN